MGRRLLEIFVLPACFGCGIAVEMAERLRAQEMPGIEVRVVDLSTPGVVPPSAVFAVPTYLIDGRVVSLGNPEEPWLVEKLTARKGM